MRATSRFCNKNGAKIYGVVQITHLNKRMQDFATYIQS